MSLFAKLRWIVLDCLTGDTLIVTHVPFTLGSQESASLRLSGAGVFGRHCEICHTKEHGFGLMKIDPEGEMIVNGMSVDFAPLKPNEDYSLKVGAHLLLIRGDKSPERWRAGVNPQVWTLYTPGSTSGEGLWPLDRLCRHALSEGRDLRSSVIMSGAGMGFYLQQAVEVLGGAASLNQLPPAEWVDRPTTSASDGLPVAEPADYVPPVSPPPLPLAEPVPSSSAPLASMPIAAPEFRSTVPIDVGEPCPVCWLQFEVKDIMHIARHESLRGDPVLAVLNPDEMLRFKATTFNARRQAIDPCGVPCTEIACPHCRQRLPPGYIGNKHHILSIVGDHAAGKSYYLSVMIRELAESIFRQFDVRFHDADPFGNALLNDMVKSLFGAQTPEQARVMKTVLDGATYLKVPRLGRVVAVPKPFVFYLETTATKDVKKDDRSTKEAEHRCSVILYDNAGEHFQPGADDDRSPGAQHIANSAGILFLFDPFNNPRFRQRIAALGLSDPQLEKPILDQQQIILAEMRVRLAKLLNLGLGKKVSTPMAVLVGKCDAWMGLLQGDAFRNPIQKGGLSRSAIEHNSALVRGLMMDIAPTVVANAEGISSRVCYFPVSSFGHTPVKTEIDGAFAVVPDPKKLRPIMTEAPPLWLFSQFEPEMVPLID